MTAANPKKHHDAKTSRSEDETAAKGDGGKSSSKRSAAGKPRRRVWRRMLVGTLLLGGLGVGGAPWIASHTPLANWALARAAPINGSIHIGSVGLSWLSPVELRDIEIRDAQGQPLAEIAAVVSDQSLIGLAGSFPHPGRIAIDHPALHLVLREGGSNLEDTLAPLMHRQQETTGLPRLPAFELAVNDGTVTIDDVTAKRKYSLEKITVAADSQASAEAPLNVTASASLASDNQNAQPGGFKFELHAAAAGESGESALAAARCSCDVESLPLAATQPFLRRVLAEAEIDGQVSANLSASWGDGAERADRALKGEVLLSNLNLAAASLGADRFQLQKLRVPCQITQSGTKLQLQQLEIDSDIGQLNAQGQADIADLQRANLMQAVSRDAFQLTGQLDLAQLARMLPGTLRVREGTEITSGQVNVSISGQPADGNGNWQARWRPAIWPRWITASRFPGKSLWSWNWRRMMARKARQWTRPIASRAFCAAMRPARWTI